MLEKRSLEHSGRHGDFPPEETWALSERCGWFQEKLRPGRGRKGGRERRKEEEN